MIKTTSLRVMTLSLTVALSGCGVLWGDQGYFHNRAGDYQKAASIAPLKLPKGMSDKHLGKLYPIPKITETEFDQVDEDAPDVPRPQPLATNLMQESVKIQRLGDERWILLNVSPGEVWPRVRSFLNNNNISVAKADISRGIIESRWLQFKTDLNSTDRYRIRIDQGVQPETSEIHVLHQRVQGTKPAANLPWPKHSSSAKREAWLLDSLSQSLARDTTVGGTSLLAQAIGGEAKSSLTIEKNEPVMKIKLSRARAQATLLHSMGEDGFSIYDSNPDAGVYYLYYEPIIDKDDEGWFSGWFNSDKNLVVKSPYTLKQLMTVVPPAGKAFDHASLSNRDAEKTFPDAPGYLLFMTGKPGDYTIRLRDPYGKRLESHKVRKLLTLLRKNLI